MVFADDLFMPRYRPLVSGDWELQVVGLYPCRGYWSDLVMVERMAALVRRGQCWMSMTPFEFESQETGVRLARGHVLVFGLGMGWAAAACAANPAVAAVTVVEKDPEVLALHGELDLFAQLPEGARDKLRLVEGDAHCYAPDRPVDLMMPDIWLPLVSDSRVDEVRAMQDRVGAASIYFWGQEMELARRAVAAGRELDEAGIRATSEETGLPLAGPELDGYSGRLAVAARRWLRGRWLPGPAPPAALA
ncbi:MAG TPA: hypothetical protein VFZ91_15360 [Allosphingosinicella sp.]